MRNVLIMSIVIGVFGSVCQADQWNQLLSKQLKAHRDKTTVKIVDPRVKEVPIQEKNEGWVDLTDLSVNPSHSKIKLMPPGRRSDHPDFAKMRKGLFQAIQRCVENLPHHTGVAIFEAYRPLSVQKKYYDAILERNKGEHPTWSEAQAIELTSSQVSPYLNNIPPHSSGAAVDMVLVSHQNFTPLPMGMFGMIDGSNPVAQTFVTEGLGNEEMENRKQLYIAATKAGLVNYPEEWWHYSIGDRYAAFALGEPYAVYGLEEPHP